MFALLASFESAGPIIASNMYIPLYNATSGLPFPWPGSFFFLEAGFVSLGKNTFPLKHVFSNDFSILAMLITLFVYILLGFNQIISNEDEEIGLIKQGASV